MDVKNVEKKDNGKLTFQVEIDSAAFEAAINKAYQKAKKDIMIPGFRKGKAPRAIIENMYGSGVFYEDAMNELAPEAYENGLKETGVRVVGHPAITDFNVTDDKALTIDFAVAMYPEAQLGQYKGLEVYKETAAVTDEQVDAEMKKLQDRNARFVAVDREAKNGDTVNIDYDGYKDGKRFDGGKDEGHDLVLGSNSFVPGFEEQLVGKKTGDECDVNITFPKDYYEGLAGADVVFKVKVNEVKEKQLPELDDEFAKDVSEFDTLDEYKASVKANLLKAEEERIETAFRNAALEQAVKNMTVTIPEEMIDDNVDNMIDDYRRNLAMQGMDFHQYLGMMGMDEKSFRAIMRPSAKGQAESEVLLEAVAAAEAIEPTEEEIEAEYKRASEAYSIDLDKIKASVAPDVIARDLKVKKAADVICENAVVTDKKPEEPKAEETAAEEKTEE